MRDYMSFLLNTILFKSTINRVTLTICITIFLFSPLESKATNLGGYIMQNSTQNKKVTGHVRASDGSLLPGASIIIAGTNNGVVTDMNGAFVMANVPENGVLVVSFIGMNEQQVKIESGKTHYIVVLQDKSTMLDEVVSIGYGTSKKGDLSGTVAVIKGDQLTKAPIHSFDQALAGKVSGVQVSSNEGQPGQGMNIVIRGVGSLTQSNAPLYVIDGFPVEDNMNDAINPEDIESISVLKDASATAIYGARGSNGVIIIETKKGKVGQQELSFSASYGFQEVIKTMDMMNPYEFVKYQLERNYTYAAAEYLKESEGITLESFKNRKPIDWQDETFRSAPIQVYNLAFRGGTINSKFSLLVPILINLVLSLTQDIKDIRADFSSNMTLIINFALVQRSTIAVLNLLARKHLHTEQLATVLHI